LITGFRKYGSENKLKEDAVEHLLDVYVKITADAEQDEKIADECREAFKKLSL
jgi:arginyl-tRNA synthetase